MLLTFIHFHWGQRGPTGDGKTNLPNQTLFTLPGKSQTYMFDKAFTFGERFKNQTTYVTELILQGYQLIREYMLLKELVKIVPEIRFVVIFYGYMWVLGYLLLAIRQ